jgi:fibronectin type 3 domain-containing protein
LPLGELILLSVAGITAFWTFDWIRLVSSYYYWDFNDSQEGWTARNAISEGIDYPLGNPYWKIDPSGNPDDGNNTSGFASPFLSEVDLSTYNTIETRLAVKNKSLSHIGTNDKGKLHAYFLLDGNERWSGPYDLNPVSCIDEPNTLCIYQGILPHGGRIDRARVDVLYGDSNDPDDLIFVDYVRFRHLDTPTPPSAPANVSISDISTGFSLTWSDVPGTGIITYEVYWGTDATLNESSYAGKAQTDSNVFDHTGRIDGATYYYAVRACNSNGCSLLSSPTISRTYYAQTPMTPPSTPSNLGLTPISGGFRISWDAVSAESVTDKIYWGTDASVDDTNYSGILETTNQTIYDHTGRVDGATYFYRIKACNSAGCSSLSTIKSETYHQQLTTPVTPTNLALTPISGGFRISWNAVSGESVTYRTYWGTDASVDETNHSGILETTNQTIYDHTGRVDGATYFYRIKACISAGCSSLSTIKSETYHQQIVPGSVNILSGTMTINGVPVEPGMMNSVRATEVSGANQGNSANVSAGGQYQMALFPGTYNIIYTYNSYTYDPILQITTSASFQETVVTNRNIESDTTLDIPIQMHTLSGRITDIHGAGIANVYIAATKMNMCGANTRTAPDGSYSLELTPWNYSIQITPNPLQFPPFLIRNIQIFSDTIRDIVLSYNYAVLNNAISALSPTVQLSTDVFDVIQQGASNVYETIVTTPRINLELIVNWAGSEMLLEVYGPDGQRYGAYQSTTPPIIVDIPNPRVGTWTCRVTAIQVPYADYPIAFVAGVTPNSPPSADLKGPYSGSVGSPITFDASRSVDGEGNIVSYGWDWNGDGVYDEITTSPVVTHTWTQPYDGVVGLLVTDGEGLSSTDFAGVTVKLIGDLDGDGDIDKDDVNMILKYRNQPASVCPACDIDGDGKITVLDSRKLVLRCTRPSCATQ